jgi:hypothetical protein
MPGGSPARAARAAPKIILPQNGVVQTPVLRAGVDIGTFGAARCGQRAWDAPVFTDHLGEQSPWMTVPSRNISPVLPVPAA